MERFTPMVAYLQELHQRDMQMPHWFLFCLGVEPARQGQGIGSQLLPPNPPACK
jgi:ribosomal protein S18 acetylase RimI-like enzyme